MTPRPARRPSRREGRARVPGHMGEFLQGRLGPGGPVVLVTLPCPALGVEAVWRPGPFAPVLPWHGPLSRAQAAGLLSAVFGRPWGRVALTWEMPPGGGAGASTAALVALARAAAAGTGGPAPEAAALARLAVALEGASDPLMHARPAGLLWASRQGRAVRRLPDPPAFDVVAGFAGPPSRTDPADARFANIADLVAPWAKAAARGDRRALAGLATRSAERNARLRGGPPLAPLTAAAARTGALGIAAAHTGPARALLYAPGQGDPSGGLARLRALGLSAVLRFRTAGHA